MMGDKPILFTGPMVRAILREIEAPGTGKTQTRRVAKITAIMGNRVAITSPDESLIELEPGEFASGIFHYLSTGALSGPYNLPYAAGDRLWVREAWRADIQLDEIAPSEMGKYEPRLFISDNQVIEPACAMIKPGRYRQGMHMPRWASRITLTVTDVRVQRVQDISEADAWEEGCKCGELRGDSGEWFPDANQYPASGQRGREWARDWFADLWDSINAERGHGWDSNPWVAAFTFSARLKNIDDMGARNEHYR